MSAKLIKEGWVEKRSQFLKQWRRRYLVLTKYSVSTYKQNSQERETLSIALREILSAVPFELETSHDFCFKLKTAKQEVLIKAPNDEEMCGWLNQINFSRKEYILATLPRSAEPSIVQQTTEASLRKLFKRIYETLAQREEEILQQFEDSYALQVANSQSELQNIQVASEIEEKQFAEISDLQASSPVLRLREILKVHKHNESPVANLTESSVLSVGIEPKKIKKACVNNIKVITLDPNEFSVRRTWITRALKWTYAHDRIDAISFTVSQNIKLSGIGICAPYKPDKITTSKFVKVLKGSRTDSPCIYSHPQRVEIDFQKDRSVFKVPINPPLALKKKTTYTVSICMQGSSTYKCVDCVNELQGPNNVIWRFNNAAFAQQHSNNRCDVLCGPIAEFFYFN